MKEVNKKTWQYEKHGIDGEVELFGVNIFDYKWENTNTVAILDPKYNNEYHFNVYKVIIDGKEYPNIIEKRCFYNKAAFKKSFKELSEKYKENQIATYQNIRGRWYECPKPNI